MILKTVKIKVPGFYIKIPINKCSDSDEIVSKVVLPESIEWLRKAIRNSLK